MTSPTNDEVRQANRLFYDTVAPVYEKIDGRRSEYPPPWLTGILTDLAKAAPEGPLLEVGCGSGWFLAMAREHFPLRFGFDLSPRILLQARKRTTSVASADASCLPLSDNSMASVAFFATLHHLPDWRAPLAEAARVLAPGGILYTDHDIETSFLSRYGALVALYRKLRRPSHRYRAACPSLTEELYRRSEIHETSGVDASRIRENLRAVGFDDIRISFHWMGLNPLFDAVGSTVGVSTKPGRAPILRVIARMGAV